MQVWLAARKAWVNACHGAQDYLQIGEERDDGTRFRCSEGEPCALGKLGYTGRFNISLHQTFTTSYTAVRAHAPIKESVRPPYRDTDERLIRIRSVPYSGARATSSSLDSGPACVHPACLLRIKQRSARLYDRKGMTFRAGFPMRVRRCREADADRQSACAPGGSKHQADASSSCTVGDWRLGDITQERNAHSLMFMDGDTV